MKDNNEKMKAMNRRNDYDNFAIECVFINIMRDF